MKVLILGSRGMAGHMITTYLRKQGYSVTTAARSNADINLNVETLPYSDFAFRSILDTQEYDFIINCVGLLVKDSIDRPDKAMLVNGWFPHYLANATKGTKTKVVHLSTDCVYNGCSGPYDEHVPVSETNAYGRSKAAGELVNDKDVTFRMSIIGPELKKNGTGLMNWILNSEQTDLPGWSNAYWNGITTLQLAKCIEKYMLNPKITGVYHVVNNENSINKYRLLVLINNVFGLGKNITLTSGPKDINKILLDTRKEFDFDIPDYPSMLEELRDYIK